MVDFEILSKFGIHKFFFWGHENGENLSLQKEILNFALFTELPSPPPPLSPPSLFLAVTVFAAGVGHLAAPRVAPSTKSALGTPGFP